MLQCKSTAPFLLILFYFLQSNWNEIVDSFDDMNLSESLLRGIYAYGFEKPSAIQQRAILPCIKGKVFAPEKMYGLSLAWVEWHLVGGACLMSARDKATPCLSQLGFWFVPMPGSCPGHMDCWLHLSQALVFRQMIVLHLYL